MIKNKDGSYNKFKLLIISLIIIITISITGVYILQNVEIPKIETPSWTTPAPTPIVTPTPAPILFNPTFENVTYNSTSSNWTYTNYTNTSNWTYPPEMVDNYTFVAGGGGGQCFETYKYDGGGGGQCFENVGYGGTGGGSSANISYAIVAGGGGGAGYTSIAHINSTPVDPIIQITPQETSNLSQNISQAIIQIFNPLGESSWLVYLILIFPMMMIISMMRGGSIFILLPIVIGLVAFGYFFNIGTMPLLVIIGMIPMIIIMFSMFSDR